MTSVIISGESPFIGRVSGEVFGGMCPGSRLNFRKRSKAAMARSFHFACPVAWCTAPKAIAAKHSLKT